MDSWNPSLGLITQRTRVGVGSFSNVSPTFRVSATEKAPGGISILRSACQFSNSYLQLIIVLGTRSIQLNITIPVGDPEK